MSFNLEEYFEEFYEKLKHIIKTRAPILHSSKTTEYGKATDSEYGHVKVEKSLVDTENPVESSVIKSNVDGINNNISGINTRIDGMTVDTELDNQSKKPVENRVITNKINSLDGTTLKLNGLTDQTLEDAINVRIPGKDGKGLEFVFKRMSIMIDDWDNEEELPAQTINPAKLDAVQEDDYVPDGWTDDQEEVTWEIPYQYVSTRTKEVISKEDGGDDYTGIWNKFTTPKLWSVYGEKPFCHLRYADDPKPTNWNDTFPQPQTDTTSGGMNYHKYEGYLWNEERELSNENKDPTLFTWRIYRPTIGVAGKEGSFLHIAYANDEAGNGFNQYEGDYIGTCVTWEEEDPNDPDLYNWVRIKGNAGIDTEFVYYTTDVGNFTGKPTNIKNQPELKKWCERPYPVSEANPYCYISVKDVKDSTWSNAVLWAKYGEQGETGERGPEGERGEDGIGLEMIFRRNSSTTNAPGFIDGQDSSKFQGTVTRKVNGVNKAFYYQDDDFVPEYWTDDQQGVNANSGQQVEWVCMRFKKIGDDGKIAEWGDFNRPKVWATYSKDGKGVISIVEKYYLYTSYQSLPSGLKDSDWLPTAPTVTEGKYLWAKSFITYTDNTVDTTDPVCITGRDGDGVHYIYYCYNGASTPNPPTKWSDIHGNTNTSADYGRWVEDPVSVTSSNKYLYMSESTTHSYDSDGNKIWVDFKPSVLWGMYVTDGTSGKGYEYAYYTTNATIATTVKPSGAVSASTKVNTWSSVPVPMDKTNKYMYISYRTKTGSVYDNNGTWSNSALWSMFGDKGNPGDPGADGRGLEHIFYLTDAPVDWASITSSSSNKLKNPQNWTGLVNQYDTVEKKYKTFANDDFYLRDQGWTDDQQGVTETKQYEYVSMRTKTVPTSGTDTHTAVWNAFNTPTLWAKYGEDGKPGDKIYEITKEPTAVSNQSYKYSIAWANLGSSYRAELKIGDMLVWHNATNKNTYIYKIVGITVNQYAYLSESTLLSGADGDGLEMIFCRSQEITSRPGFTGIQNTPSFTGTVKRNGVNYKFQDDDYVPDGWTDNQSGVNEVDKYEWVSMRQKVPDKEGTSKWGGFSSPSLWASYSEKGKDGTEITGDEIMTKIEGQSIDAQTIGGISPSELITTTLLETDKVMDSSNHGFYKAFKMGRIIVLIFKDYFWTPANTSGNQTVVALPTWAKNVVSPRTYFTNFNGDVVSVTDGGVFTYSPKSTTTVNISGTFVYIGDDAPSISTSISLGGSQISVTSGGSVTVTLTSGGKALGNKPVKFQINNQVYTKTTKNTGQASLNINLSNGTYTLSAEFQGDKTYGASTTTATLTVGKIANAFFSKESSTSNNVIVKSGTSANPGQPISNLNCKANLEGTFHYMSTDYKGIINTKSMLNTFKGTKTITFYNNDSRVTSLPSAGFSLTGTRATQDYTKTLSPSSVGGPGINSDYQDKEGTWWNYATAGSLINKNDGAYAQTDILNPGAQGQDLYVSFNTGIPTNASIKEVVVSVNCGARHGWNSSMKPIFNNCTVKIINSAGTDLLGVKSMPAYNQDGCDNWYTSSYSWTNTFTNSNNQFLYPAVVFQNIRNSSSDYNGRFGIDWISMYVKYEI